MDKIVVFCGIIAAAAVAAAVAGSAGSIIGAGVSHWFTSDVNSIYVVSQIFGTIIGVAGLLVGALFGKIYTTEAAKKI